MLERQRHGGVVVAAAMKLVARRDRQPQQALADRRVQASLVGGFETIVQVLRMDVDPPETNGS